MENTEQAMQMTCLHDKHIALGAKMSPFAGFDMPIEYNGIVPEHNAVRHKCGIFDVSHMGEVLATGPQAEEFVNHIFTNDVREMKPGNIQYGMMLHPMGGTVDDLLVYKMEAQKYFLVINAANINKDYAWMVQNSKGYDVVLENQSEQYGQVAIQGPEAEAKVEKLLGLEVSDLAFYTSKETTLQGEPIIISRTGYTGEDGFEIYASHDTTRYIWDTCIDSGEVLPCGLGCRDTLRFEVGLPLYGHELNDEITPVEAGLSMFCKLDKPEFIGKDVLVEQKANGVMRRVIGIELHDRAIPRNGYDVEVNGEKIGYVTTGYNTITTGKSVCMALIDARYAKLDTEVEIRIRKKTFKGIVVKKRFYQKNYKK